MMRRFALMVGAVFVLVALAYNFANPQFEATDEIRHFRYIRYLTLSGTLPPVSAESSREMQAHHPPLYYALSALITFPIQSEADSAYQPPLNPFWGFRYYEPSFDNKNQYLHAPDESWRLTGTLLILYLARLVSLLFGLGTVLNAYRLGRTLFAQEFLALSAMAFTAFNPMFLHGSVSVNNDTAAAFFGSWVIVEAVHIAQGDLTRKRAILAGVAMGLGILAKASVWTLLPIIVLAYGLPLARLIFKPAAALKMNFQTLISNLFICLLTITLLSGWWFVRNYLTVGDVLGLSEYRSAWTGGADPLGLFNDALTSFPYAWTTVWARFNYGQIVLPEVMYQIWGGLCILALLGLARAWRLLFNGAGLTVISAIAISLAGWGALMITIPATANARLVFQIFPALGVLLVLGWFNLIKHGTEVLKFSLLAAMFCAFALYALFGYLAPAYAYPATATVPQNATPLSANFENVVEILGYKLSQETIEPGDQLEVTIYWKPLATTVKPFPLFVHLIDPIEVVIAQRDTYHGLGAAPSNTWRVGNTFADTYRLIIPETLATNPNLKLHVGVFNSALGRPLLVNGREDLELGLVRFVARPFAINFGDRVSLVGYEIDQHGLRPGERLHLTTFWKKLNYVEGLAMYAHLVGMDGRQWAAVGVKFGSPVDKWSELHGIDFPLDMPRGIYMVEVGVLQSEQNRLPVLNSGGQRIGTVIDLVHVRVDK